MGTYRSLKPLTINLFGYPKSTIHAGQVISTDVYPQALLDALQGMTRDQLFEPVDYTVVDEKVIDTPKKLEDFEKEQEKKVSYDELTLDDLRLQCDAKGVEYSKSNNAKQLAKKLTEADNGEHEQDVFGDTDSDS